MISLLPLNRIIASISVIYAALLAVAAWLIAEHSKTNDIFRNVSMVLAGSTSMSLLLLFIFHIGWKSIWSKFPSLNTILFPNLEGAWRMTIQYNGNGKSGEVEATAIIKQDFLKLSMEVESLGSDSKTLIAQPKKDPESGRPFLYYMYEVEPRRVGATPVARYTGSAILRYSEKNVDTLSGNYFTSVGMRGRFVLTRI